MSAKTIYIACFLLGAVSVFFGALFRLLGNHSGDILIITGFVLEGLGVAILLYTENKKTRA